MAKLDENGIKEKLRGSVTGNYLIYGNEAYLKKLYSDKLAAKCVDGAFADFNLHILDGSQTDLPEIYDSTQALPLMAPTSCVVVRDMPVDFSDDDFELLEQVLSETPDTCALIFVMLTTIPSGAKWSKTIRIFDKYGFVIKLDTKTPYELYRVLESGAKKRSKAFAKGAPAYLVDCVGSELTVLLNETEKLCAYCKGDEITKADIDTLCTKSVEATAFEMIKELNKGRFDAAFMKLDALFYLRTEPNMILGALIASYADIYRARCAVKSHRNADAAAQFYDYENKEFRLQNAARDASKLSFETISQCIDILAQADSQLKGSPIDGRLVLERTLVELALAEGNKRK